MEQARRIDPDIDNPQPAVARSRLDPCAHNGTNSMDLKPKKWALHGTSWAMEGFW